MLLQLREIAKSFLSYPAFRALWDNYVRIVSELFGSSRILTHLFVSIFPIVFNREQAAVMRGRRNYYRLKKIDRRSRVELRRNIHRLEKGLIMVPRKPIFAKDYIDETIAAYSLAIAQYTRTPSSIDVGEVQWAHDVLEAYFQACTVADPVIDAARDEFVKQPWGLGNQGYAPVAKLARGASTITYNELLELAKQRRSVRSFARREVDRADLDKALELASLSPSACNRLPYEFRIFDDPNLVSEIAKIPFGTVGYSDQIPTMVVVIGKLDSYFSPRDRHAFYIDSSLATMSFLFALETLGLSSCTINWPDFEPLEAKMQKRLGLSITERVVMLVAVGHAQKETLVPYSQKKELDTFRFYNRINP